MLVPSTVTNEVEPPRGGGATYHQVAASAPATIASDRVIRVRAKRRRVDDAGGALFERAAGSSNEVGTTTVDIVTALRRP